MLLDVVLPGDPGGVLFSSNKDWNVISPLIDMLFCASAMASDAMSSS